MNRSFVAEELCQRGIVPERYIGCDSRLPFYGRTGRVFFAHPLLTTQSRSLISLANPTFLLLSFQCQNYCHFHQFLLSPVCQECLTRALLNRSLAKLVLYLTVENTNCKVKRIKSLRNLMVALLNQSYSCMYMNARNIYYLRVPPSLLRCSMLPFNVLPLPPYPSQHVATRC